jgi:glucose/arabinose dehydrogenase
LLSLAFDPGYGLANNYLHVYCTPKGTAATRAYNVVVRVATNGNSIIPGRGKLILRIDPLGACDHNGGAMHFGKDSKLYITIGDNGINTAAQSLSGLHGKMLRINPNGTSLRTIRSAPAPRTRTRQSAYWDCATLTPSMFNPARGDSHHRRGPGDLRGD